MENLLKKLFLFPFSGYDKYRPYPRIRKFLQTL